MKYGKQELALWGLGMLGGKNGYVSIEDLCVYLFQSFPSLFSMVGYPQYPDIASARTLIQHAKKTKSGSFVRQGNVGKRKQNFMLTPNGADWFDAQKAEMGKYAKKEAASGSFRASPHATSQTEAVMLLIRNELANIPACKDFHRGKKDALRENDFYKVFSVSPSTPRPTYEHHKTRVLAAMSETPEYEYVLSLSKKFDRVIIKETKK